MTDSDSGHRLFMEHEEALLGYVRTLVPSLEDARPIRTEPLPLDPD